MNIFAPEQVWSIKIHGMGVVHLRQRNSHPVICKWCKLTTLSAAACAFHAGRFSTWSNGYICDECIVNILRLNDWHFQETIEQLYPAESENLLIFAGDEIANAFLAGGERGLFARLTQSKQAVPSRGVDEKSYPYLTTGNG